VIDPPSPTAKRTHRICQQFIELNPSGNTVKKYLFRVFDKLGISSRVELVLYAVHHSNPLQAEWLAGVGRNTPIV
jgi:hypothetical protein